jgi:hypothetical protein
MDSTALHNLFRSDVRDEVAPYLWSSLEIYAYIDDAQKMFCRMQGGISDASSALTQVAAVANQAFSTISPKILKIRELISRTQHQKLELVNAEEVDMSLDISTGPLRRAVVGVETNKLRWLPIPSVNQTVEMLVYRLPTVDITTSGQTIEIDEQHHRHLLCWMKHLAHMKQDAETYDKGRSDMFRAEFLAYCDQAKAERERREHKYRTVAYGGY